MFAIITEKIDQDEYKDMNVSNLINQYNASKNDDKLKWLKTHITVEAMKYVAKECMIEACSIPNELVERVIRSVSVSNTISSLKTFIEKYHNTNEEDDLTKLQEELRQIDVFPVSIEQQTSDNMYWIISKQATNPRRLRIYLYCPELEIKSNRVWSVFFLNISGADRRYPLKLAKEDIPWLYWSDFQVAPNFELLCSIFDQERKIATATISASSQVIVVEEQSLQSKSKRKNVTTLSYDGNIDTNTKNIEIFKHLIDEVKDESSFCFTVTIAKDLK
ncbi:hypothetical protein RFI_26159, partial [Reticulomyxa filosa]